MANLTNYPFPAYEPSTAAAGVIASLIGLSLIAWIIQSVQVRFQQRRLIILLLISHLTIFVALVLRAALPTTTQKSRAAFTAISVLLAVGQRLIILGNYAFLIEARGKQSRLSRAIFIGTLLAAIGSTILMAPAGTLSYNSDTIGTSFRLRQAAASIVLCMTVLFYPVWFASKTITDMTKRGIILLIISSLTCVVVAIFILVTAVPDYYVATSQQELWFYIFQITPIVLAQFTWTILHPKRSVVPVTNENKSSETIDS